jgi:hypothetical protein
MWHSFYFYLTMCIESDRTSERDLFGVKSLLRQPITPTMTNIYINFVIFLKHENFLKYEKILNCHGNVEMLTYNWLRMKISINHLNLFLRLLRVRRPSLGKYKWALSMSYPHFVSRLSPLHSTHNLYPLFWWPIIPTTHYSDSPFFRQPIIPTAHYSDNDKYLH